MMFKINECHPDDLPIYHLPLFIAGASARSAIKANTGTQSVSEQGIWHG